MSGAGEKFTKLMDSIESTAIHCGRNPGEITLVAVTKFADTDVIREVYNRGHRDFGGNYLQKMLPKIDALPQDIDWHFIGTVQKKKINSMLGKFVLVHTVDSQHIALAFDERAAREETSQRILIEVKTAPEGSKQGIESAAADELAHFIMEQCPNLKLEGLMTVAPYTENRSLVAHSFDVIAQLREQLKSRGIEMKHLSMGMTNDWELAIEYGATILRIGSAIFG